MGKEASAEEAQKRSLLDEMNPQNNHLDDPHAQVQILESTCINPACKEQGIETFSEVKNKEQDRAPRDPPDTWGCE